MLLSWIDAWKDWLMLLSATWYGTLRDAVLRFLTGAALFITLLWLSVFLYGTFYYSYMPAVSHSQRVHLQFRADCQEKDIRCGFPSANLSLIKENKAEILMRGQKYQIQLDLEMPESPVNQNHGMFMIVIQFYTRYGEVVQKSARSAMLRYKSSLLQTMETLFYSPFLVFGAKEQKQMLSLELMDKFIDDPYKPALGMYLEVQSKNIELYSALLKINTHFTGLRYIMYYYPISSAIFGISTNLVFLLAVAVLSWYQFMTSKGSGSMVTTLGSGSPSLPLSERKGEHRIKSLLERQREASSLTIVSSRPLPSTSSSEPRSVGAASTATGEVESQPSQTKASLESKEEPESTDDKGREAEGDWETVPPTGQTTEDTGLRHRAVSKS